MRRGLKFLSFTLILFLFTLLVVLLVPWRELASRQLHSMLWQATGQNIDFTLAELGLNRSQLRDISIGSTTESVVLSSVTLAYSIPELWQGQLRQLHLAGLNVSLRETPQGWYMPGWQTNPSSQSSTAGSTTPLWLQPHSIPLHTATLSESSLTLQGIAWELNLPISLSWQSYPTAQFLFEGRTPRLNVGQYSATTKQIGAQAQFVLERAAWQGEWTMRDIALSLADLPVPPLQANGALALDANQLMVSGSVQDTTKGWQASFSFTHDHSGEKAPLIRVSRAQLPMLDGTIKLRDLHWPLDGKSALKTTVILEKIRLRPLLQHLTDTSAEATGTVSGTIPVTRHADGRLEIPTSTLETDTPGTLVIPAAYLPGDNEQMALLRAILSDLRYDNLRLTLSSDASGALQVTLGVSGHNPAVQNGKPVKLNVNLGGDVLGLLNNQLLSIIAPTQLLRNSHDEK